MKMPRWHTKQERHRIIDNNYEGHVQGMPRAQHRQREGAEFSWEVSISTQSARRETPAADVPKASINNFLAAYNQPMHVTSKECWVSTVSTNG